MKPIPRELKEAIILIVIEFLLAWFVHPRFFLGCLCMVMLVLVGNAVYFWWRG